MTTADELFSADQLDAAATRPEAKEALRYRRALIDGVARVRQRPLLVLALVEICSALQVIEMDLRDLPGPFVGNLSTRQLVYTPSVGRALVA